MLAIGVLFSIHNQRINKRSSLVLVDWTRRHRALLRRALDDASISRQAAFSRPILLCELKPLEGPVAVRNSLLSAMG